MARPEPRTVILPDANRVLSLASELWVSSGLTARNAILNAADRLNAEEHVTIKALDYFDRACEEWPTANSFDNLHRATWAARL